MNNREIGNTIKALRQKCKMTGIDLAQRAHMSQSKISKIETGFYNTLKYGEIKDILNILKAPSLIQQQVLHAVDTSQYPPTTVMPLRIAFSTYSAEAELRAHQIHVYVLNAVPALLQTMEYRRACLRLNGLLVEDEISHNLKITLRRQDELWNQKRNYHFVITEAALYTRITDKPIHCAQLDRMLRLRGLPNITIGIIPTESGLPITENSSFGLYDDHTLIQAITRGEITSHDREDIELHTRVFSELTRLAYYHDKADVLIHKALDYFS